MSARLIAYECIASAHQPGLSHPDKLTVHKGEWAFCPFDARAGGHQWRETGGVDVESITRRVGLSTLTIAAPERAMTKT